MPEPTDVKRWLITSRLEVKLLLMEERIRRRSRVGVGGCVCLTKPGAI